MAQAHHKDDDVLIRMKNAVDAAPSTADQYFRLFDDYLIHHVGKSVEKPEKLFAISDLHVDCPHDRHRNRRWLMQLPVRPNDAVIVAGDVCTGLKVLRKTLATLIERFGAGVFYCPGNHELWTHKGGKNSIQKLLEIFLLCDELGVHTTPTELGDNLAIVPLQGWWMGDHEGVSKRLRRGLSRKFDTMDSVCSWPPCIGDGNDKHNGHHKGISNFFYAINERALAQCNFGRERFVVTFGHYVPSPVFVEGAPLEMMPVLCAGPTLASQIKRLGSAVHVFGHSHIVS